MLCCLIFEWGLLNKVKLYYICYERQFPKTTPLHSQKIQTSYHPIIKSECLTQHLVKLRIIENPSTCCYQSATPATNQS